jgi:uncharacterized secreted protein with C-terminal beta-propeller domain
MFEKALAKLLLRTPGNRRQPSSPRRTGPLVLHAERLEDRLLMSANKSSVERRATSVPSKIDSQVPVLAAPAAAKSAAPASAPTVATAEAGWKQFGSKAAFEKWLMDAATAKWGNLFGQTYGGWNNYWNCDWNYTIPFVTTNDVVLNAASGAITASNSNFSTTNLQAAGVDEADLIETDGSYLYIISGNDLVIVEAGVGDALRVLSRVHLGERPTGMFLAGDRLAIVSAKNETPYSDGRVMLFADINTFGGYEPSPPTTTVAVYNIGNRAAPTLVQRMEMDGRLVAARTVDGELRLVLNNQIRLPDLISRPIERQQPDLARMYPPSLVADIDMVATDAWLPNQYGQQYVYETRDEYVARVRDEILTSFQPRARSLASDGSVLSDRPLFDPAKLYRPDSLFEESITTIATFNLASNRRGPLATSSVMTSGDEQVYATADSIYLFSTQPFVPDATHVAPHTNVFKFSMRGGRNGVMLAAKGSIEGTLLNQFAADEQDGFLRVVTQNGWSSAGHSLQVLNQVGRRLEVVGSVDGIAPREQLYSVRFVGERAFFVTFRQVDPLFAVDLSDPTDPRLMGELKIPGYSDYLQPIDETHLLAIGRGADERTGLFQELQVSIFDVSDLANPQLVHRYSFEGGRSTETPATGNRWTRGDGDHHAVSYFADQQILALPIFSAEANWWTPTGAGTGTLFPVGQGGLQVFKIDVDTGFTPIGVIEHESLVERSVRIGDRLFAVSSGAVSVHELANPTVQLGEVSIAAPFVEQPIAPIDFRFLPLESAIRELPSVLPIEAPTLRSTVEQTTPPISTTPVGWASPSLVRSRRAHPAVRSSPVQAIVEARADEALITMLAEDSTSRAKVREEGFRDAIWESNKHDDRAGSARELQLDLWQ